MNITFATSGLDFCGDSLNRNSLGGSETALASMAREFARLGHRVMVFCQCSRPGEYEGVRYEHVDSYHRQCRNLTIDVQIISRFGHLWHPDINAGINMWWLHDMPSPKNDTMMYVLKADMVALLSDFHIQSYQLSGAPIDPIVWKTANGVDMDLISKCKASNSAHPARFLYSSLPERGLDRLVTDIWPRIKQQIPLAELCIAGYDLSSIQQMIQEETRQSQRAIMERAARTDGVRLVGSLNKSSLYSLMKSCTSMIYPTTYPEIFCITAVEAQACGLPIITTNMAALPETVGPSSGILVDGGPEYAARFADEAVRLVADPARRKAMSVAGPEFVNEKGYVWSRIAKQWETKFEDIFRERRTKQTSRVISTMVRSSDLVQARLLAEAVTVEEKPACADLLLTVDDKPKYRLLSDIDRVALWNVVVGIWKHHTPLDNKRILNASGFPEFGDFLKQENPTIQETELKDHKEGDKYDAIYISDEMASVEQPHGTVLFYHKMLRDDGLLLTTTPYGALSLREDQRQLWSFTSDDLRAIAMDFEVFGSIYAPLFVGDRGEWQGYWVTCFGGGGKVNKINLTERAKRYRPEQTLSVCMIAKDEERWMNMSLSEAELVADEIIVVDCKSTDRTVEFAEYHGAKVFQTDFHDFSQARNESLDHAVGDWILWLDCDERLVNGGRLRKYMDYPLANAYTVRQNHLIVDGAKDCDTPARLVRNKPHHRFVGMIHEHCEDVSDPDILCKGINPTFECGDVDIAHYGYVHEQHRRKKAILRNMDLLIEDAKVNLPKGRMLTWVLAIRDYLNATKWHFRHIGARNIEEDSFEHELTEYVIDTYHTHFAGRDELLEPIVAPMYQEACSNLSSNGLQYRRMGIVPFQGVVALTGDYKPIPKQELAKVRPEAMWFIHPDELRAFLDRIHGNLGRQMFNGYKREAPAITWEYSPGAPDPVAVLTRIRELYKRG